jgi:hypothetical protein
LLKSVTMKLLLLSTCLTLIWDPVFSTPISDELTFLWATQVSLLSKSYFYHTSKSLQHLHMKNSEDWIQMVSRCLKCHCYKMTRENIGKITWSRLHSFMYATGGKCVVK